MRVGTIVARNYLALARVLAQSLHRLDDRLELSVLVLDADYGDLDETQEPFEVLHPADLDIEPREFHRMAAIYDILELATALKPWLLQRLLETEDVVTYLDPDIEVFSSLAPIEELAARHSIVLTPHTTTPDAPRRTAPERADDPAGRRLQSRVHRGLPRCRLVPVVVVGATATRVPHRRRPRTLRRPALDRLRAELLRAHRADGRGLQRRVLEPSRPRGEARLGRLRGQRPPAAVHALQRIRPAPSAHLEQVPDR